MLRYLDPSHLSQQLFQAPTSRQGRCIRKGCRESAHHRGMEKNRMKALSCPGALSALLMGIIHTGWQGKALSLPLHLGTSCQSLLSFTGPNPMRWCYPWCRGKACVNPQGLLPPIFFQDALNSSNLRNGCRRMHQPGTCLSLVASFFQLSYTLSKRKSPEIQVELCY